MRNLKYSNISILDHWSLKKKRRQIEQDPELGVGTGACNPWFFPVRGLFGPRQCYTKGCHLQTQNPPETLLVREGLLSFPTLTEMFLTLP